MADSASDLTVILAYFVCQTSGLHRSGDSGPFMTHVSSCARCGGAYIERSRETLAGELERAVALADRAGERKWQALTAQLFWFASELRGRCTNCTLEECAGAFAAAQEKPNSGARYRPRLVTPK